jgi:hypothetical protein
MMILSDGKKNGADGMNAKLPSLLRYIAMIATACSSGTAASDADQANTVIHHGCHWD